ncbi:Uncharacterised protein [Salmonella enterica subsp. indica]|uniref:Uncharacterized protein n=1 Tax=Salmonella enterica subsp. indica TaxID=59207 RepID=A0A379XW54_SALER|nr:Uncharacterised protein [Salmonella enterica subsp. indica]
MQSQDGFLTCLMAAALRAVAAQRANPLPADLSSPEERFIGRQSIKQKALSEDRAFCFV